jgi:hypothetical protein
MQVVKVDLVFVLEAGQGTDRGCRGEEALDRIAGHVAIGSKVPKVSYRLSKTLLTRMNAPKPPRRAERPPLSAKRNGRAIPWSGREALSNKVLDTN